jgi:Rha family phage regulatory protein
MQEVLVGNVSVVEVEGEFYVTSLQVADDFEKEHKNVLQAIENLDCSEQFSRLNFQPSTYKDSRNKTQKMYLMTRDGFTILAMGFNGPVAMPWKEKYIDAFNGMERELTRIGGTAWLHKRIDGKLVRKPLTDAIQRFVKYAVDQGSESYASNPGFAYMAFTKMEYKALFLLSKKVPGLRDQLSIMDLASLSIAERAVTRALDECMEKGLHYKEIYQVCKGKVETLTALVGVSDKRNLLSPKEQNPFALPETE